MQALATPVEIAQHPDEFGPLLNLYAQHQPRRVLEIGTYYGGTLYHWLVNAEPGTTIVTIDDQHRNRNLYDRWHGDDVDLVVITGNSHDAHVIDQARRHGPYDFVFIDADHHYTDVKTDWLAYSSDTTPGALVAFHDITPTTDPTVYVDQLWAELRDRHQVVELEADDGYGIGIVYMP